MGDFDLDLQSVEEDLVDDESGDGTERIVLGVLDGTTPDEEWLETIEDGHTLVLRVEGDVNELAAGFAREVSEAGGELMTFKEFLVVTPPGVSIDASRVG
jgi:hypothetical protein